MFSRILFFFWPDNNGDRIHSRLGRFKKEVSDFNDKIFTIHPEYHHNKVPSNTPLIPRDHIVEIFNPRKRIQSFLE